MTPEEAENFHEDDEDPQRIFARFDAARQIQQGRDYIRERYRDIVVHDQPCNWYARGGDLPGGDA